MLDGSVVVRAIEDAGFTHVVWIPDSHLGTWDSSLRASSKLKLVLASREGEATAIAGGLMLGGAKPLLVIQCTGMFEAGDAIRNFVHDLGLPLKMLVGVRGRKAFLQGKTTDNCPRFSEPFVKAWDLAYSWFDVFTSADPGKESAAAITDLGKSSQAKVLLWAE